MTDYHVEVKVKNNLLMKAMKEAGAPSSSYLFRQTGIPLKDLSDMLNLKMPLYDRNGYVREEWETLAAFLRVMPEDLVPKEVRLQALKDNKRTFTTDSQGLSLPPPTPEVQLLQWDAKVSLGEAINSLNLSPKRKALYLKARGLLGYAPVTYTLLAKQNKVTLERVRQIVKKIDERLQKKKHLRLLIRDFN